MEDHLHVFHPRRRGIVHEPAACDGGVVGPVCLQLGVAPVDEPIGREIRIEREAEQAALAASIHRRQAGDGGGDERAVRIDDAQAAGRFSVTSILPPGRNAMAQGLCNPDTTVVWSNATFDFRSGAWYWPATAGF